MTENDPTLTGDPDQLPAPDAINTTTPLPTAARTLMVMAPFVQYGMLAIGILSFIGAISGLTSGVSYTETQRFQIRSNAAVHLVFYGLTGWMLSGFLKGFAAVLGALVEQARAVERTTALVEVRLASALERVAAALERAPVISIEAPPQENADRREQHLAEFRAAIEAGQWNQAYDLADSFASRYPDDPEGARLVPLLDEAKQAATHALLARLDAAREVHDPERVLDLRDLLNPLLSAEALQALDRELARWCMGLIQKRLRTGTMGVDVATLAARVAQSLDTTTEGASLRAALPTLRRSAGLCARCGKPYTGIEDACPECLQVNGELQITKDEENGDDGWANVENGDE
jgi:hypothetical protein